jgi:hypothetical protein
MHIGLGSIDNEVGIGQKIHGMPSNSLILLNLWKHTHIRDHSTHSTHRRWHARPHYHVLPLHQIWKRLLFRLGWSQSIFSDHSHFTDTTELLIWRIRRWILLDNGFVLHVRGVEWDDTRRVTLVSQLIRDEHRVSLRHDIDLCRLLLQCRILQLTSEVSYLNHRLRGECLTHRILHDWHLIGHYILRVLNGIWHSLWI